jgi:HPt (histidine-containing phosphotransfer) domain-containing protein
VGWDVELLEDIAQLFLDDAPRMLAEIATSVQDRDAKGIGRSAHALKGCVLNFGAQRLFEVSLALEQKGSTSDLSNVDATYCALEAELHRLEADLRSLLAHTGLPGTPVPPDRGGHRGRPG